MQKEFETASLTVCYRCFNSEVSLRLSAIVQSNITEMQASDIAGILDSRWDEEVCVVFSK